MGTIMINIAEDFSVTPGPRFKKEGSFSGELFMEKILRDKFKEALQTQKILLVNLDGTAGYATSFLEESFGGLQRESPSIHVEDHLQFISEQEPFLVDEIKGYILDAR